MGICLLCTTPLIGKQRKYCSVLCKSMYWQEHHTTYVKTYKRQYRRRYGTGVLKGRLKRMHDRAAAIIKDEDIDNL